MKYINLLKYRLFGLKPAGKGIKITGISHSVVSEEYTDKFKHWDKDKFNNIKTV